MKRKAPQPSPPIKMTTANVEITLRRNLKKRSKLTRQHRNLDRACERQICPKSAWNAVKWKVNRRPLHRRFPWTGRPFPSSPLNPQPPHPNPPTRPRPLQRRRASCIVTNDTPYLQPPTHPSTPLPPPTQQKEQNTQGRGKVVKYFLCDCSPKISSQILKLLSNSQNFFFCEQLNNFGQLRLIDRTVNWSINLLFDRSIDPSFDWLIHSFAHSFIHSFIHSLPQTTNKSNWYLRGYYWKKRTIQTPETYHSFSCSTTDDT